MAKNMTEEWQATVKLMRETSEKMDRVLKELMEGNREMLKKALAKEKGN
jgi:hypothetical protein